MKISSRSIVLVASVVVVLIAPCTKAETDAAPPKISFCAVVRSPIDYNGKIFATDVILWPSDHSLSLFGSQCRPSERQDITTEAVLPVGWDSAPQGRKLRSILKSHKPAKVELLGTFIAEGGPYGQDSARFRFTISRLISVSASKIREAE